MFNKINCEYSSIHIYYHILTYIIPISQIRDLDTRSLDGSEPLKFVGMEEIE